MKPFCYHPFDLRQLVSFAEIARTGSFRQAAKVLHIAQPALSRQIKQLEAALGISLFDRAPRRLHLTIEGRDVLPPKKRTRNSRFSLVCHRRNRVTLSPEPPGIFRLGLAPAGPALRPVDRLEATHACRLQGCIGARGASPQIEELFARHPDHDLFGSLPGAGPKIAPRLLAEIGDDRERFDGDAQNLQCLGGTAPVTRRSGKYRHHHRRWACDKHLRHAMHLFC
jgi:hypothetical protein